MEENERERERGVTIAFPIPENENRHQLITAVDFPHATSHPWKDIFVFCLFVPVLVSHTRKLMAAQRKAKNKK